MREEEILIAGFLESRVQIVTEGSAGIFRGLVPENRVLLEAVVRREIESAAKPPSRLRCFGLRRGLSKETSGF